MGELLMSRIKMFESFSGIGTTSMAMKRLGVDYEVVGIAEIDKFAIQSYMAIHGETKNYGDISKIDPTELPDMDLFTYSFPCQDLSISGKQRGMSEETRSGLLYECEKVITTKKPKYLLLENVKNLVGKKFKPDFDRWLEWLESQGYRNYWQVLNAKDYGVPQNRERVFVVSILGEETYEFPEAKLLEKDVGDLLINAILEKSHIVAQRGRYNQEGKIVQKFEARRDNLSNTLTTVQKDNLVFDGEKLRQLTPLECWRLMGIADEDFYKSKDTGISDSQLYKQAGNAIVVDVLVGIFRNLFNTTEEAN